MAQIKKKMTISKFELKSEMNVKEIAKIGMNVKEMVRSSVVDSPMLGSTSSWSISQVCKIQWSCTDFV